MGLLEVMIVVLLLLWVLGLLAVPSAGGLVHILLVIVLVLVIVRLVQGRKIF